MERKKTLTTHGLRVTDIKRIDPRRSALARETAKVDIAEEQELASEVYVGEVEWPEY